LPLPNNPPLRWAAALVLALLISACVPAAQVPGYPVRGPGYVEPARFDPAVFLTLVNGERSAPLRLDPRLSAAAAAHAADMAARGYFDHLSPEGSRPGDRVDQTGYRWRLVGETIAEAGTDVLALVAWNNSPSHRAALIDPRYTEAGVGRVGDIYVLLLAAPG